jgi:virulence-associated protein VapD
MFAITFDLVVDDTEKFHPKGIPQAYSDIASALRKYGFRRIQGSVYVTDVDDLANLFAAIDALRSMTWFPKAVRDVRAFRVEQWSDFTGIVKGTKK